jgi:hypothetical protein
MLRCLEFDSFIGYDARYLFRNLDMNQVFASKILKPSQTTLDFWHSSMILISFPSNYCNAGHLGPQEDISS